MHRHALSNKLASYRYIVSTTWLYIDLQILRPGITILNFLLNWGVVEPLVSKSSFSVTANPELWSQPEQCRHSQTNSSQPPAKDRFPHRYWLIPGIMYPMSGSPSLHHRQAAKASRIGHPIPSKHRKTSSDISWSL